VTGGRDFRSRDETRSGTVRSIGINTNKAGGPLVTVDVEVTNRCNARCDFCPRELTPHQGLMSAETFEQALVRTIQLRDDLRAVAADADVTVSICGLGEPLLNGRTAAFVRRVREAGLKCELSTNASLLDEAAGHALLDAGLDSVFINSGEVEADYDAVYGLPFARTRDNIRRFAAMASGRCHVRVVVVDQHDDRARAQLVEDYWRALGVEHFSHYGLINRGGSLAVDSLRFALHPFVARARALIATQSAPPICGAPFRFPFVGYDGNYYLCSSDWEKRVPLGSVFDESFTSTVERKLDHVHAREPICRSCSHDPVNRLAQQLETVDGALPEATLPDLLVHEADRDGEAQRLVVVLRAAGAAAATRS
jgi:MoaA/NifB/PqqE/SkfB family radical SAM enzyme